MYKRNSFFSSARKITAKILIVATFFLFFSFRAQNMSAPALFQALWYQIALVLECVAIHAVLEHEGHEGFAAAIFIFT